MDLYQHDHPSMFRFRLIGELDGDAVKELEYAWQSVASVLKGRPLLVDISAVTSADAAGLELLAKMRATGADVTPASRLDAPVEAETRPSRVSQAAGSPAPGLQADPVPSQ